MKTNALLFIASMSLLPALAAAVPYWGCWPNKKASPDPTFLVIPGESGTARFIFDKDLVRSEGTLPAGEYDGVLKPSSSGFSNFANLNVEKYFPNAKAKETWFSLPLSTKSKLFLADAYVLWEYEDGTPDGLIVGQYACRAKGR